MSQQEASPLRLGPWVIIITLLGAIPHSPRMIIIMFRGKLWITLRTLVNCLFFGALSTLWEPPHGRMEVDTEVALLHPRTISCPHLHNVFVEVVVQPDLGEKISLAMLGAPS